MRTYEVIAMSDAIARGLPAAGGGELPADAEEYTHRGAGFGVWQCDDGKPTRLIGHDGGEPEDQNLDRDWEWVASALAEAYCAGHAEASRDALPVINAARALLSELVGREIRVEAAAAVKAALEKLR